MIAMLETPDHATIARFVARHEAALAGLFGQVLRLCDEAGLVRPGVVAIDGTRLAGNASRESTHGFAQIAREILAEAKATDEAEDELYGDDRGDELPERLRTREGRAEFFRQAREQRAREATNSPKPDAPEPEPVSDAEDEFEFDVERIVARHQGREGWTREARRQLEQRRWETPDHVSRAREDRLLLAGERLEAERDAQVAANRAYEDYRKTGRDTKGRKLGRRPKPWVAPEVPEGVVSVSDPDTQRMKANHGYVQGYNAQTVVDEGQIVLAAEITNTPGDFSNLNPMITAAIGELERAGVAGRPQIALADAQYWNEQHMDEVIRQQAHRGADPARLRRPNGAPAGLDRRAVRVDASCPGSPRQGAVPKTHADDRARVRSHQAQPHDHPLPPQRQNRRTHRMATTNGNPQPHKAPPPPARHRRSLKQALVSFPWVGVRGSVAGVARPSSSVKQRVMADHGRETWSRVCSVLRCLTAAACRAVWHLGRALGAPDPGRERAHAAVLLRFRLVEGLEPMKRAVAACASEGYGLGSSGSSERSWKAWGSRRGRS